MEDLMDLNTWINSDSFKVNSIIGSNQNRDLNDISFSKDGYTIQLIIENYSQTRNSFSNIMLRCTYFKNILDITHMFSSSDLNKLALSLDRFYQDKVKGGTNDIFKFIKENYKT